MFRKEVWQLRESTCSPESTTYNTTGGGGVLVHAGTAYPAGNVTLRSSQDISSSHHARIQAVIHSGIACTLFLANIWARAVQAWVDYKQMFPPPSPPSIGARILFSAPSTTPPPSDESLVSRGPSISLHYALMFRPLKIYIWKGRKKRIWRELNPCSRHLNGDSPTRETEVSACTLLRIFLAHDTFLYTSTIK